MIVDNSLCKSFWYCPRDCFERYFALNSEGGRGIQFDYSKVSDPATTAFGTRIHQLLAEHFGAPTVRVCPECGAISTKDYMAEVEHKEGCSRPVMVVKEWRPQTPSDELIEAEAQVMMADYRQRYLVEDWEVLEVEATHYTPLPGIWICPKCHEEYSAPQGNCPYCEVPGGESVEVECKHKLAWKADLIVRDQEGIHIVDHKSEKRGSGTNLPEAWAARNQVSLYQWAVGKQYPGEKIGPIILDVLTRQSPKGQEPPSFRRDRLQRDEEHFEQAIRDVVYVAEQIEALLEKYPDGGGWPSDTENCVFWKKKCQFYDLHILGRTEANLSKYKAADAYIKLEE